MKPWFLRPISLRSRLVIGVSAMLLPLIMLAGGSVLIFNNTLANFDQAEGITRDQSVLISELEFSLLRLALLTAKHEAKDSQKIKQEISFLTKSIEVKLRGIEKSYIAWNNSPSQPEIMVRLDEIWNKAKVEIKALTSKTEALSDAEETKIRDQIFQYIRQALYAVNNLNYNWEYWQYDANRVRAQNSSHHGLIMLIIIGILAISLALLSGWAVSRTILVPLSLLEDGVSRFSAGDLSFRIHLQTHDELARLAETFNQMAHHLEKTQVHLINQATLDGLTGVYNRREFNRLLQIVLQDAEPEKHPVSLLMIDIDHFKKLNDTYGHQAGDVALQKVANLLKKNVRPGDIVARYGGEEFSVVLPGASSQDAAIIAERVRSALAAHTIQIAGNQTLTITASLGLATFPSDAAAEEKLIKVADEALYTAKRSGRNQVCRAPAIA